ncbi:MAG: alpha/beta fold hydrolase [Deltaproteobacteria bacterium]|nr:alpha/beta fold hydrolase [Deltaproteobacteria bacterium]
MRSPALALLLCLHACGTNATPAPTSSPDASQDAPAVDAAVTDQAPSDGASPPDGMAPTSPLVEARPYTLRGSDASGPSPLVLLLHGYGASGSAQDIYFRFGRLAESEGFLLALPDGSPEALSRRLFWNATEACCDFAGSGVDDVAYLSAVVQDVRARRQVDPRRIYVVGHSNGGFMAHRLACERSGLFAAAVSLAGALGREESACAPTGPVAVLQVHGTMDTTVRYEGGVFAVPGGDRRYPSASDTVARWARYNRCGARMALPRRLDLDGMLAGEDTRLEAHIGCMGGAAELWTIEGGAHIPNLTNRWAESVYAWLQAHPRAEPAR